MTTSFASFAGNAQSVCDFTDNGANKRISLAIGIIMVHISTKSISEIQLFPSKCTKLILEAFILEYCVLNV